MTIKCDDTVDVLNGEHIDNMLVTSKSGIDYLIVEYDDGTIGILNK